MIDCQAANQYPGFLLECATAMMKHGKPVAALVRPQELANLERLRKAGPEGGLASLAGGWEGSEELVQILNESAWL
jgi:hypothetical protein